jgi:GT2 family glycosyltransferase
MTNFAVLFTCFNRKEKTLEALSNLYTAVNNAFPELKTQVYLTDDGSTDGTSENVKKTFPHVIILKGNGNLYWAGGMRNSWNAAIKKDYDAYLLLNDDTNVNEDLFTKIIATAAYAKQKYGKSGIYIGATWDPIKNKMSYSGSKITNWFLGKSAKVSPDNDIPMDCDMGNANIMCVPANVVAKIGILPKGYVHGMADYGYTLKAKKNKIPVLVMPGFCGECHNDHKNAYAKFIKLSFKERLKMLKHPIGLDFTSQLNYMKNHFPLRLPIVYAMGYFKVFFPKFYYNKVYKTRNN